MLTFYLVHPEGFTYKLPDNVSFGEGAMVEPFAIGMQAAFKARIAPGDVAAVVGAGTIGTMIALAALAGGCSKVFIADFAKEKLKIAGGYPGIVPVNIEVEPLSAAVARATDGWGADVVFEASGSPKAYKDLFKTVRPGGCVVLVGMPIDPAPFDVVAAAAKEARIETVFRYANVYDRALALISSGKVNLKPLITGAYAFADSIAAFERAAEGRPTDVKLQIRVADR